MPDTPAITSKNLPTPPVAVKSIQPPLASPQQVEVQQIPYDQIVAKPLRAPNFISLKPKNPNMSLFWGNRSVGEKESGMRYDQLIAMGFLPAKPDQVLTMNKQPVPPSLCRDGRIMYGDLILLIISREDYVGVLKWNEQSARQRVKKPGVTIEGATASQDIGGREVINDSGGRKNMTAAGFPNSTKVSTFIPALAEVDSKTADNSGPESNLAERS